VLNNEYAGNGKNQIIGRKATGFSTGDTVARDANGKMFGRVNSKLGITRDAAGRITSTNQADAGSLFDWER
jgi:hypothetical protein